MIHVKKWLQRLDAALLDLIYPEGERCLCCGRSSHGMLLCQACADNLDDVRLRGELGPRCGGLLDEKKRCRTCRDCGKRLIARSAWLHRGAARTLVLRLKHSGLSAAAPLLAKGMAEAIRDLLPEETVVTWITMPKERWRERVLDHGQLLAKALGEELHLPVRQLLTRQHTKKLATQASLSGKERRQNQKGTYCCEAPVSGTVLLVDDVLTTGSTLLAAGEALRAAGAERVLAVTATRGGG